MANVGSQSLGQKLKTFFFLHWEKLVFGIAALSLVLFVYFGRAKSFTETTPRQLDESVKRAERYIADGGAWNKIAEHRQGNETAVAAIQNERTVKPEWYQVATISGHPLKTRGLRADPEIKTPIDQNAQLLVASLVVKKPRTSGGNFLDDYWTVLESKLKGTDANSQGPEMGDDVSGGGGGMARRMQVKGQPDEEEKDADKDKKRELVYPDVQMQEEKGVAVTRLGVNSERHTSKVVSSVSVTALFPHELQSQEFKRCFMDSLSYSADRDKPQYVKLEVQRRKMVDGVAGEWEDISEFVTKTLPREFYAARGPEVVEEPFVDPVLTLGVPPFVFADFRKSVAHPKVPRIKVEETKLTGDESVAQPGTVQLDALRNSGKPSETTAADESAAETKAASTAGFKLIRFFDMFDFNVEPSTQVQYRFRVWVSDPNMYDAAVVARLTGKASDEEQPADDRGGQNQPPSGGLGASGGGLGMKGAAGSRGGGGNAAAAANQGTQVDFLQLDPTVRERLRKLETEKFPAGEEWKRYCRSSEWSEETNWVPLPYNASEILAGRVEFPNPVESREGVVFSESEPMIDIAARKWDRQLQVPVSVAQKVARGSVINFRANGVTFNPITRKLYELDRDLDAAGDTPTGVDFHTDSMVVDLLGGQKLPISTPEKAYYFPAEVLVMDPSGTLRVHNTSDEKQAYRHSLFEPDESLTDLEPKKPAAPKEEASDMPGGGRLRGGRGR